MSKIISIVNQKGGVGKTTTTINLGAALAHLNKKVLIIDFDEQANATKGLGIQKDDFLFDMSDFFSHVGLLKQAIIKTDVKNLSIIPASIKLSTIEESLYTIENNHYLLRDKLELLRNDYDFILIDCPPSLGLIVTNALYASDSVIIPVDCSYYAYDALTQMTNKIAQIQKNKDISIEGILITKLDNRTTLSYEIIEKVNFLFPNKIFKTVISYSSHVQQAPLRGKSVIEFSATSRASREYRQLAQEIIGGTK